MSVEMSFKKLIGVAGVAAGLSMFAVTGASAAPDPNFHIYIAYGQSNMEGNARNFTDVDKKEHPRVKMFATTSCPSLGRPTVGEMYPAVPPMFLALFRWLRAVRVSACLTRTITRITSILRKAG